MKNFVVLVSSAVALGAGTAWAQGTVPKLIPPAKVVSLHRPTEQWKVVTTVVLKAEMPASSQSNVTYRWSGISIGELACDGLPSTTHEVVKPPQTASIECTFEPAVGPPETATFRYTAKLDGDFAGEAEIPVEVRDRGLRWEFKSTGATVTSDAPDPEALAKIPDIVGGTSQDFLFVVNWQTLRPRQPLVNRALALSPGLLRKSDLQTRGVTASRSANFLVETGVQTEAVAATVVDVGKVATTAESGQSSTGTTSEQAVARRNLVLRGEFNVNASFNADGTGRFLELGLLGKGSFSSVLDSNESFKEAIGRVLQVIPKDRSAYKFDGGVRLALKQSHETDMTTLVNPKGDIERPSNIENYFLLEFGYRLDSALSELETDEAGGDSKRRWALRAEFSPELPLPGHQLPTIGLEVSRAFAGGPPSVKVTYGLNLSATKGVIKDKEPKAR